MTELRQGLQDGYHWLWSMEARLQDVLAAVPELVVGHFVAVTSFDSGPYRPSVEERSAGWCVKNGVAITPRIGSASALRQAGWDEWYVLNEPSLPLRPHVFVNYSNFAPMPDQAAEDAEILPDTLERAGRFWGHIAMIKPLAFIADNEAGLSVVVCDEAVLKRVLAAIAGSA